MKTAGYDIVVLLRDELLNEISGALFYNNFLTFNGKKDLRAFLSPDKLNAIPASLKGFLDIRYRFKLLYEPLISFLDDNRVGISARLRVYLWIFNGLEVKFDAGLTMETPFVTQDKKFQIALKDADIKDFEIHYGYSASQDISLQLDEIFEGALHAYFSNTTKPFAIDLPSIKAKLPYVDENFPIPIEVKAIKSINGAVLAGVNLFGYTGGQSNELSEFARNCNVGVAISEIAMKKVYDYFWDHTTWQKRFHKSNSFKIEMVDKALDFVTSLANFILSNATKILSLGFLEQDIAFISSDFIYSLDIDFRSKPTFDLQDGNRVRVFNLGVDLMVRLKMFATFDHIVKGDTSGPIPDECTPWNDDIVLERERKTVIVFDLGVPIRNLELKNCTGEVFINEEKKNLQCKVLEIDINIFDYVDQTCKFLGLPGFIRDKIVNGMKEKLLEAIPPLVLSPTIFELDIKLIDWKLNVEGRKLEISNDEAVVGAYLYFKELQKKIQPVPKYIGNFNNMEVHRAGCDSIMDTYETHQRGYYLLQEALNDGYDGCKKCLPAFHHR